MWGLHVINCLTLCFAPHVLYFYATELVENETITLVVHGAACSVVNIFLKYVLLATFLPAADTTAGIPVKTIVQVIVSLFDVVLLWYAVMRPPQRQHLSNEHKFQGVGLGWAFGDSLIKRLVPIVQSRSTESAADQLITSVVSNIVLARSLSFASVGVLLWGKRFRSGKAGGSLFLVRLSLLLHAIVPTMLSILEQQETVVGQKALILQVATTAVSVGSSYLLYATSSRKTE